MNKLLLHASDFGGLLIITFTDIDLVWKLVSAGIITIFVVVAKYWDIANKKLDNRIKELEIKKLENEEEDSQKT